ncbi:MAG: hypothetical protein Q8L47_05040 [bacterium]|nr:hypothetical protein [bacterium]
MKNKGFANILLIVLVVALAGIAGYFILFNKLKIFTDTWQTQSSNYEKITWVSIPPEQKGSDKITTRSSAICLPGTECEDTIVSQPSVIDSYFACTSDDQCSFFSGFTGLKAGEAASIKNVPAQTRDSAPGSAQPSSSGAPTMNTDLPATVNGAENCFNKKELLKTALNKDGLKEDISITCECGIQLPTYSSSGEGAGTDANIGEVVTGGTGSRRENKAGEEWSCMKPEMRPDIMTENFIFPQSVNINSPFSISFDYKNIGTIGCLEIYFQADITRTIAGKSEYLGGSQAHILRAMDKPLKPGDKDIFTFGSQLLPLFNLAGDYKLDLMMMCEAPRETHEVNGVKEIRIQVN